MDDRKIAENYFGSIGGSDSSEPEEDITKFYCKNCDEFFGITYYEAFPMMKKLNIQKQDMSAKYFIVNKCAYCVKEVDEKFHFEVKDVDDTVKEKIEFDILANIEEENIPELDIDSLDCGVRLRNCLNNVKKERGSLRGMKYSELLNIRNFGRKSLVELIGLTKLSPVQKYIILKKCRHNGWRKITEDLRNTILDDNNENK